MDRTLNEVEELRENTIRTATQKAQELIENAEQAALAKKAETDAYCDDKLKQVEKLVEERWRMLSTRLEDFYAAHEGLKELLGSVDR